MSHQHFDLSRIPDANQNKSSEMWQLSYAFLISFQTNKLILSFLVIQSTTETNRRVGNAAAGSFTARGNPAAAVSHLKNPTLSNVVE